jgi:hypothetical protein
MLLDLQIALVVLLWASALVAVGFVAKEVFFNG